MTVPSLVRRYDSILYLVWTHTTTPPVVQVVMEAPAAADAELELPQETLVIHHIDRSEDIKTFLSGTEEKSIKYKV